MPENKLPYKADDKTEAGDGAFFKKSKKPSSSAVNRDAGENPVIPEDEVKLKPILGIRPGAYLAFAYGLAVLIILFFIFLYPGISRPGSVVTVITEPRGAAVLVDGVYMEPTPCEIFIPQGQRTIELRLPGFGEKLLEMNIGGRILASTLFPLRMSIHEKLSSPSPAAAFADYAAEYAAWTFTGEPSAVYQVPLSLSEGAYRLGPYAADQTERESMEIAIAASARFAVTRAALRDLVRAKSLLDNNGLSPSPLSLLSSAADVIAFLDDNPQAALWLGAVLSGDAQSQIVSSPWYAEAAPPRDTGKADGEAVQSSPVIRAGMLSFRYVSGDLPRPGANFPPDTKTGPIFICETVISTSAWEQFCEQRPEWKSDNLESLMEDALVNEEYLAERDFPGAPGEGVSGISWYAARAFCEWLNTFLPSEYASSYEVRLPAEAEWEYAAKSGFANYGDFWEWCNDSYAPLSFLSIPAGAADAILSPEKVLKGGSWVNPQGSTGIDTRGSLPPSFCSAFVSARPVIAPKRNP